MREEEERKGKDNFFHNILSGWFSCLRLAFYNLTQSSGCGWGAGESRREDVGSLPCDQSQLLVHTHAHTPHTHVHTLTCSYMCTHIHTYILSCAHTNICAHTLIHTRTYTCTHSPTLMCTHIHTHTYILICARTHSLIHSHTYAHTLFLMIGPSSLLPF